MCNLY